MAAGESYVRNQLYFVWIEKRMRGIAIREELTDEWKIYGLQDIQHSKASIWLIGPDHQVPV